MTKTNKIRKSTRKLIAKRCHGDKPLLLNVMDLKLKKKAHLMYKARSVSLLTLTTMKSDSISKLGTQIF